MVQRKAGLLLLTNTPLEGNLYLYRCVPMGQPDPCTFNTLLTDQLIHLTSGSRDREVTMKTFGVLYL